MIEVIVIFLVVYTLVSIYWFLSNLGNKYREETWVDIVILIPVLLILPVWTCLNQMSEWIGDSIFRLRHRKEFDRLNALAVQLIHENTELKERLKNEK